MYTEEQIIIFTCIYITIGIIVVFLMWWFDQVDELNFASAYIFVCLWPCIAILGGMFFLFGKGFPTRALLKKQTPDLWDGYTKCERDEAFKELERF